MSRLRTSLPSRLGVLLAVACFGCGPKSVDAKLRDADKIGGKIDSLLNTAEKALGDLEPAKAEEALKEAAVLLKEPDLEISPERDMYSSRHAELAPRLAQVKEARAAKDIEDAVRDERAQIGPSLQAMKDAAEAISGAKVDERKIGAARDAVAALEKAVGASDDRRTFALKDSSFQSYLKRAKGETEKARAEVTKAEKKLKFVNGPIALKAEAAEDARKAKIERDAEKKRALMTAAAQAYAKCASGAGEFGKGGFEKEKIGTATVESVLEACKAAQATTESAIAKLPKPKKKK